MFRRFVSGSTIACVAIAGGALGVLFTPAATQERFHILTVAWCFVPTVWGLWAVFAPVEWVPQRFPIWGAILGLIAGVMAAFVLNVPSRILGETVSVTWRGVAVVLITAFYYILWMLVRVAYRLLATPTSAA